MPFVCNNDGHRGERQQAAAACCRKCFELVCATCPPVGCCGGGGGAGELHDLAAAVGSLTQLFARSDAAPSSSTTADGGDEDGAEGRWRLDALAKITAARRTLDAQQSLLSAFYREQSAHLTAVYEAEIAKAADLLLAAGGDRDLGQQDSTATQPQPLPRGGWDDGGANGSVSANVLCARVPNEKAVEGAKEEDTCKKNGGSGSSTCSSSSGSGGGGGRNGSVGERPLLIACSHAYRPSVALQTLSWRRVTRLSSYSINFESDGVACVGGGSGVDDDKESLHYYFAGGSGVMACDRASSAYASAADSVGDGHRWIARGDTYSAVCRMANGRLLAALNCSRRSVQTFTAAGELVGEFSLAAGAARPSGLCETDVGHLLVTDVEANRVSAHDPRAAGALVAEVNKIVDHRWVFFSPECAACVGGGRFVVSDGKRCSVLCLDYGGRLHWRFGRRGRADGELWAPAGVCSDGRGRVYVADRANRRVAVLAAADGQLVGHVGLDLVTLGVATTVADRPYPPLTPTLTCCDSDGGLLVVVCAAAKRDERRGDGVVHTFSLGDF